MSQYRRYFIPGGTYFFTVVTHRRRPFLTSDIARPCLRQAIREVRTKRPLDLVALVLLPDHLHTVWTLPPGDSDYPMRWRKIKEKFTRSFLANGGTEKPTKCLAHPPARTSDLATAGLGAYMPRRGRCRALHQLRSLESGQTWAGQARAGLPVVDLPPLRATGRLRPGLGR
jgi:REP element-mobilizing transposase RayT